MLQSDLFFASSVRILRLVAFPVGWAVSEAILALLFFGLITPMGLVLWLLDRDTLGRRQKENHSTYWTLKPVLARVRSYFRQF
jgi:hypothetical protein